MSEDLRLETATEKVSFIMDNIPQARHNYKLLMLSYWQLFDGVDIPKDVIQKIAEQGTQPETIARSRRRAVELVRIKQILEMQRLVQAQELDEVEPQTN